MIYFDNAATTGTKPFSVVRSVDYALKNFSANPGRSGHDLSQKTALAIYDTRKKAADFFGADGAEQVIFTPGCTYGINYVLKGVLSGGGHVIVSDLEHNAVVRPLHKMGVDYSVAEVSLSSEEETVENFSRLIRHDTVMIFCTGASNVIGKTLPIEKIGTLCKNNNLLFGVDAAQIAGVLPINMKDMNIDFLCVASHKGLYAPMGVGMLIARKPVMDTVIEGGTGTNSAELVQPDYLPERLESGTLNVSGIYSCGAGIDFVNTRGIANIYRHEMQMIQRIYKGLSGIDFVKLYTEIPQPERYCPVLSFNIDGESSDTVAAYLNKKGIAVRSGLHCAAFAHKKIGTLESGTVRVSPSVFNTFGDCDYFVNCIKNFKKQDKNY